MKVLNQGDEGEEVRLLQVLLSHRESECLVTGLFDQGTKVALMKYQRLNGIRDNEIGEASVATWKSLLGV